jgi:polar amino acid transport system substrate-binding protein
MKAMRVETTADMPQLFTMLAVGRADVLFAPRDEAEYYLSQDQGYGKRMRIIAFKEMPQGYHRHLMCSQQVSDNDIARFDAALARRAPR